MTEAVDHIGQAFAGQRDAVDEGRELVWSGLMAQRQVDDTLLRGLETVTDGATRDLELTVAGARYGVAVTDSLLPGDTDRLRATAEDGLDALERAGTDGSEALVAAAERGFQTVEQALLDTVLRINSQINDVMAAHERLEARLRATVEGSDEPDQAHVETLLALRERVAAHRRRLRELYERLSALRARVES